MQIWLGAFIAIVIGGLFSGIFLYCLREYQGLEQKCSLNKEKPLGVPPWLTGLMERSFFFILIWMALDFHKGAFEVMTAMFIWIGLKMASNWHMNLPTIAWDAGALYREKNRNKYAMGALLSGLLSMSFAGVGGLIASGRFLEVVHKMGFTCTFI